MSASYHRFKLGLGLKKRDIFKPKNRFDLAFDDIENLTLPLKEMSSNGDFAKGNNRETKYVSSTDKRSNIPAEGFVSKELGKQ